MKKEAVAAKEKKKKAKRGRKTYINECSAPKTFHFAINFSSLLLASLPFFLEIQPFMCFMENDISCRKFRRKLMKLL